jgi:hypothetical protein
MKERRPGGRWLKNIPVAHSSQCEIKNRPNITEMVDN